MSSAAKWGDPVLGIDVHMVMLPPIAPPTPVGVPGPLPHPFIGVVFDPVGAAVGAAIGAVFGGGGPVFVNGMPCGNTGTDVEALVDHKETKPGIVWAPFDLPDNEGTIVTGSKTVHFGGASEGRFGSFVMSCGFPINLPTSLCMSVPLGAPVNIGGPDAMDFMAAATRAIRTKWVSDKLHKLAKANKGSWRSKVICFLTGHPVDVVTGQLISEAIDFETPGLIPVVWERTYRSRQTIEGPLGPGWYHAYDEWIDETPQGPRLFLGADGRVLRDEYPPLRVGEEYWDGEERFMLRRTKAGYERRLAEGLTYFYARVAGGGARYRLVRIADRAGNAVTLDYDRSYLVRVTDTAGRELVVAWNRQGRIASVSFEGQPLIRYEYDEQGTLIAAKDALDHAQRYEYSGGVMVKEITKRGVPFFFEWDWEHPEGWCIRTWGEDQGKTIYDRRLLYDKHRHVTRVEDGRGAFTQYWGNGMGLVDKEMDPMGGYTQYTWDDDCRKTSETNPLGQTHHWTYDDWGNCIEEIDAARNVTRRAYDEHHQLVVSSGA